MNASKGGPQFFVNKIVFMVFKDTIVIVSVVYSGTLAYDNIKPGDIVTKVNGEPVPDKATAKKVNTYCLVLIISN